MNKSKLKEGLSLITLVITIVVIVILVGAIVLSISSNNPINQSTEAVLRNDLTTIKEQYAIEYANALAKHKGNPDLIEMRDFSSDILSEKYSSNFEVTTSGIAIKSNNKLTEKELVIAEEIFGVIKPDPLDGVKIPEGFYYTGGTKDTGIVISDNIADKDKGDSYEVAKILEGNQYVWIPIANEDEFIRRDWNKGNLLKDCVEPYNGYIGEISEYNENKVKVIENQGFYIARYEASNNGAGVAESKALKMPWNNIQWNNSDQSSTIGAGTAIYIGNATAYNLGYTSVKSSLVYGVEWDSILKFIENTGTSVIDTTSWGNFVDADFKYIMENNTEATKLSNKEILLPTGATERHMKQNISDIAGNVLEWTTEIDVGDRQRINRGGSYGNSGTGSPAAIRFKNYATDYNSNIGFRVVLYIN